MNRSNYLFFPGTTYLFLIRIFFGVNCRILVDHIPIRVFNNLESIGVPFANKQPMRFYATIWDGDQWATRGGKVKTDWSKAPFTAYYRYLQEQTTNSGGNKSWYTQGIDRKARNWLRWVQKYHMIYNYCSYPKRPGAPKECRHSRFH